MEQGEVIDYDILIRGLNALRKQVIDNFRENVAHRSEDMSSLKRIATELERLRCSESYDHNTE
jgi:hypothetical protein